MLTQPLRPRKRPPNGSLWRIPAAILQFPCLHYDRVATWRHQHTPFPNEILIFPNLGPTRVPFSLPQRLVEIPPLMKAYNSQRIEKWPHSEDYNSMPTPHSTTAPPNLCTKASPRDSLASCSSFIYASGHLPTNNSRTHVSSPALSAELESYVSNCALFIATHHFKFHSSTKPIHLSFQAN